MTHLAKKSHIEVCTSFVDLARRNSLFMETSQEVESHELAGT